MLFCLSDPTDIDVRGVNEVDSQHIISDIILTSSDIIAVIFEIKYCSAASANKFSACLLK